MKHLNNFFLISLSIALVFLIACENDYPSTGPDDPLVTGPTPVIADISPDSSYAGIGIVTITGQNFSSKVSENRIFFNGNPGKVLSATETELEVQVPTVLEDSILIQLNVKDAILFGEYGGPGSTDTPFKLIDALTSYVSVDATKEIGGLACDLNEYIYTILRAPRGIVQITNPDSTNLPRYSTSPTLAGYGMKWGPSDQLYFVRKNKNMYRTLVGGGGTEIVGKVSENQLDLDFDQNNNILLGGVGGLIFRMTTAGDTATVAQYDEDYTITVVRVYDGYLYSVLDYVGSDTTVVQRGIWRNQIMDANGTLGSNEFMFDWDSYAGEFGPEISSLVIDENGMFYLGAFKDERVTESTYEAIIKLDIFSGFAEPLYSEILNAGTLNLCWGNTNFLYIHHYVRKPNPTTPTDPSTDIFTRNLIRLAMPLNSAPYYGRQ